jgi:competence protein ComEA
MNRKISIVALLAFVLALALPLVAGAQGSTPAAGSTSTTNATPAPAASSAPAKAPAKGKMAMRHPASAKVDLNTASREDLMKVPGIGEAIADKIIAARPFNAKSELLTKKLVNRGDYAKISAHVIAHQAVAAK